MATETRETAGLIGNDKVEGTNVYGADRQKMINKRSGQVAYAVLSFGGFSEWAMSTIPFPSRHTIPISKAIEPISPRRSSKGRQNTQAAVTGTGKTGSKAAK